MTGESADPRTENDTRAIARSWVITRNGAEVAAIVMSATTLSGFRDEYIESLLGSIAECSHEFYLDTGNALRGEA